MQFVQQTKKTDVFTPAPEEKIQGSGGNAFDRIKRILAAKARETLISIQQDTLPNIPLFFPSDLSPGNGEVTGRSAADLAREERPSRLAPLIILSVLGGFILLRVFR